jgi:hypothetical protein
MLVSKLSASIRIALKERTDVTTLLLEIETPRDLGSLEEVPAAIAEAVRQKLERLRGPAATVSVTAPVVPVYEQQAPSAPSPVGETAPYPSPRRSRKHTEQ